MTGEAEQSAGAMRRFGIARNRATWAVAALCSAILFGLVVSRIEIETLRASLGQTSAGMLALAMLLLCLPTLHPWYLMLLVPLIPLMRRPTGALVWCALAPIYWLHGVGMLEHGGTWTEDRVVSVVAHLPAVLLLAWDLRPARWLGARDRTGIEAVGQGGPPPTAQGL